MVPLTSSFTASFLHSPSNWLILLHWSGQFFFITINRSNNFNVLMTENYKIMFFPKPFKIVFQSDARLMAYENQYFENFHKAYFWIILSYHRFLHEVSRLLPVLFSILSNACYGRTFWWTHSCIQYYNTTLKNNIHDDYNIYDFALSLNVSPVGLTELKILFCPLNMEPITHWTWIKV